LSLLDEPLPRLVRRIAIPAGLGLLFQTLFNIVDTYWAGYLATEALAALALSFPVFFIVIACGLGFGWGSTALIANALGAQQPDRARALWLQALLLAALVGLAVAALGIALGPRLVLLLGGRGRTLELALAYLLPIMAAAPVYLLLQVANARLAAAGDTRSLRDALAIGTLVNVGLDPLLMFGIPRVVPGLGITGLALATVLITAAQALWLWRRAARLEAPLTITRAALAPQPAVMVVVLRQAVPVSLTMLATGLGLAVFTHFMSRHGDAAVAGYGIGMRVEQLVMLPMIGLNAAALAIIGQNFGAQRPDRVRAAALVILGYGMTLMLAGAALVWPVRFWLIGLFSADPMVIALGGAYLGVATLNFVAYALLILGTLVSSSRLAATSWRR
jgi:putative MATE family efflux protein